MDERLTALGTRLRKLRLAFPSAICLMLVIPLTGVRRSDTIIKERMFGREGKRIRQLHLWKGAAALLR